MIEPQGNLVKTYHFKDCTVEVYDAAYAGKTEAELDQIRLEARRVACDIVDRAAAKGIKV
ncbi:MAG: hypothetical protein ACLSE7_02985 [Lachnospirales bacterium]|jgi:hypothetical protein